MTQLRPVVLAVALGGLLAGAAACGGAANSPAAQAPSPSAASTGRATGKTLSVKITGKNVDPAPSQVDLPHGQTLTLTVTSDHDDELHAHGVEVEKELKAGVPTTITLRGDLPGVYEVETHNPPLRLLSVAVR